MTQTQTILIKKTWRLFRFVSPAAVGDAFYGKLFADSPGLRKLFPANMEAQYRKLLVSLNVLVARLENKDEIAGYLAALAKRHAGYGVKEAHYMLVGNALLWTLQQGLGNDWNADVAAAWAALYQEVADIMIQNSHAHYPAPR
ncbi:globin domain-containing protein [Niabella pedocola]|uniref:Globin domain-containing protein n=1 Tax=Niabella pedocola TaxID=1752077 RepID=A0ABS8PP27_9BACT|nr:globin domain-containing protein [Niabella pedocola]MCD2422761.1 globin domain-containing protein [Niabella pedocola]